MRVHFTDDGWDDYSYWSQHDRDVLDKLNTLIEDVRRRPFTGLGKPEPLRGALSGCWSRRITQEHRLVYLVDGKGDGQAVTIIQCRIHY